MLNARVSWRHKSNPGGRVTACSGLGEGAMVGGNGAAVVDATAVVER
jgi:hypothetical protein